MQTPKEIFWFERILPNPQDFSVFQYTPPQPVPMIQNY